jgi:quercetin dioxygenase-like cupin family protein
VGKAIEGGDSWDLSKGSVIVVPAGVPHSFKAITKDPWLAFGVEVH